MKKFLAIVMFLAIGFTSFAQNSFYQHKLGLNAGSSFLGMNTNAWVKGALVKRAYATPTGVLSYTYMVEKNVGVGIAGAYQMYYFDLLPIDAQSSAALFKINRVNLALTGKYFFVNNPNFDMYGGAKVGGTFWYGEVSFGQLYDYIGRIAPDFIAPILQKRIIPSNLPFAATFFSMQLNFGADFYFSEHVGIKTEVAFGAPYWGLLGVNVRL